MYTIQKENADYAHILTRPFPYAHAFMKGLPAQNRAYGRISFFPAGDRGILVRVQFRGLSVSRHTDADLILQKANGLSDRFLPVQITARGLVWESLLTDNLSLLDIIGSTLFLCTQEGEALAQGTVLRAVGQK